MEIEREARVLTECEVPAQGADGVGPCARSAREALAQPEGRRLVAQVGGCAREQAPTVVPGLAPGCETVLSDRVERVHPAPTLSRIAPHRV